MASNEPNELPVADEDPEDLEDPEFLAQAAAVQAELRQRLNAANIAFSEERDEDGDTWISFFLPAGRDKRQVRQYHPERIRTLLVWPFERYKFVAEYTAIWSAEDDVIEAAADPLNRGTSSAALRRLTGKSMFASRAAGEELSISVTPHVEGRREIVTFGLASPLLSALNPRAFLGSRPLSVRLSRFGVTQHDQAKELLERVASALFFEIDYLTYVPFSLARERRGIRKPVPLPSGTTPKLQFPRYEYDKGPLSLYWYGRSAIGMPLLQFLAYYQVLEFYFPVFSRVEAQRRIRNVLKEPTFDPQRDSDIARILTAVRVGAGRSFGDERAQLRATLQECLPEDDLREYIESDEARHEFFGKKSEILGVGALPLKAQATDLRLAVADRIYAIRCKIVHTKTALDEEGQIDLLLPFAREAEALSFDIGLVQFAARRALVATSSPLHLPS